MMQYNSLTGALALILVGLLTACGSSPTADDEGDTTESAGGEADTAEVQPGDQVHASAIALIGINPPEVPWSEMERDDREMDMVSRFHPIFREFFQNHDPARFAEFGCESCHGADMRETHFTMPNPALPPVPAAGTPEYEAMGAEHADMVAFMEQDVTANMQTMLGMGATLPATAATRRPEPPGHS